MPFSFSILLYALLEQMVFFFCPCNTTHIFLESETFYFSLSQFSKPLLATSFIYMYVCLCTHLVLIVRCTKQASKAIYNFVPQNHSKWSSALSGSPKPSSMFLNKHHKYMMVVLNFGKLRPVLTIEAYLIPIKSQTTPYV